MKNTYADILSPANLNDADLYLRGLKKFEHLSPIAQEAVTRGYQTLRHVHQDGGRDAPFKERMRHEDVAAVIGGDPDVIAEGYNRLYTNEVTQSLMARTGTDADRPADTSPPTISELLDAAYDTIEGASK